MVKERLGWKDILKLKQPTVKTISCWLFDKESLYRPVLTENGIYCAGRMWFNYEPLPIL